jgi:hypothetical protein
MTNSNRTQKAQTDFLKAHATIQAIASAAGVETTIRLIAETVTTRDAYSETRDAKGTVIGWQYKPQSPAGPGWDVLDRSRDDKTTWRRWIVLP